MENKDKNIEQGAEYPTSSQIESATKAIEKEKKSYEQNPEGFDSDAEGQEENEVEILEFGLNENEIDELIGNLVTLKQTKSNFSFEVDDENELQINYDGDEE